MPETHLGICNFCDASCGIEIEHEGREILSIRGDARDPFSRGHICPKAVAQKNLFDDPDRLRAPAAGSGAALDLLLRIGPHRMTLKELKSHPHGIDLGPLQPRLRQVIGTPDRRVHLVPAPLAADLTRLEG